MIIFCTRIIILMACILSSGQPRAFDAEAMNERTLPPDLEMVVKKTDTELAYEACMTEFSLCFSAEPARINYDYKVCAVENKIAQKRTFHTFCELLYENCLGNDGQWGYLHDGPCDTEYISAKI